MLEDVEAQQQHRNGNESLRDAAKGMWDSGHHLLFIAHILLS